MLNNYSLIVAYALFAQLENSFNVAWCEVQLKANKIVDKEGRSKMAPRSRGRPRVLRSVACAFHRGTAACTSC